MSSSIKFSPLQRFWLLLKPDAKDIRNVYFYAVVNGLISLSLPLGIQAIVNLIQGGQINSSWVLLVILVVAGVGFSGLLQIYQMRITETIQQRIFTRAAFEFAYRIPRIKLEELYRFYAPELMNRFFDTISVQKGLSKLLIDVSAASLQVLFGLILLAFYHPFFIVFGLILVLLIIAIFSFTARRGLSTSLSESNEKYKVAYWLEELARTANTFKLSGSNRLQMERTDRHVLGYIDARRSHFKVLIQQFSLLVLFKVVVATGLLAIGGILVMEQHMNIGQFIAAEIIILLIMASVEKLIVGLETIYDVLTSLEKIGQVTDLDLDPEGKQTFYDIQNYSGLNIELDGVSFKYPGGDKWVLNKIDLKLNAGDRTIITGVNGSGKSTLLQVVCGMYDINQGSLSYNDVPFVNLNRQELAKEIGNVLSQEELFEGTLADNISMGIEGVSFEHIKWAASVVGLTDYIKSSPEGYATELKPLGKQLARSIVQKILLARSIVHKPRLLVLENALEGIDDAERISIIDFLVDEKNPWTLIAVSQDPYFRSKVDYCLEMQNGVVNKRN